MYNIKLPNAIKYKLEDNMYNSTGLELKSLKYQFAVRENNMIANLRRVLEKNIGKKIIIVVGDTHLREQIVDELGPNIFRKYLDTLKNIIIYRSPNKELL